MDHRENIIVNSNEEINDSAISELRVDSSVAIDEVVEVQTVTEDRIEDIDDDKLPFEIMEDLEEYQNLWHNHQLLIEEALSDTELSANFQNVVLTHAETTQQSQARKRAIEKIGLTGFNKIVNLYIASGRLKVSVDTVNLNQNITSIEHDIHARIYAINRVGAKTEGLFNPRAMPVTPSGSKKLNERLLELEEASKVSYAPIYELEQKIELAIFDELVNNPQSNIRLIEAFLQFADSEILVEKTFSRFLANRYELYGQESELGYALSLTESFIASNIFAKDFIKMRLAENDGDNLMTFFAAKTFDSEADFIEFMSDSKTFNEWPQEYKKDYKTYMSSILQDYSLAVKRQVQISKHRAWMMTDAPSVEDTVDHYFLTFYPGYGYEQPEYRAIPKRQTGRVVKKSKQTIEDVSLDNNDYQNEQSESIKKVIEARRTKNNQFETQNGLSTEEIIARHLGGVKGQRLSGIFLQAIESLRENPFPTKGVSSVAHQKANHIIIDGKLTKIYRANLVLLPGITVPSELQNCRIIYAINRDNLIIISAFSNHDEYDQFIASLS